MSACFPLIGGGELVGWEEDSLRGLAAGGEAGSEGEGRKVITEPVFPGNKRMVLRGIGEAALKSRLARVYPDSSGSE
jgi:hypothetical protein